MVGSELYWLLFLQGQDVISQLGWKRVIDVIKANPGGGSLLAGALALDGKFFGHELLKWKKNMGIG
jgi:hypothetical protein